MKATPVAITENIASVCACVAIISHNITLFFSFKDFCIYGQTLRVETVTKFFYITTSLVCGNE